MTQTRLVGFEASALRSWRRVPDEELAGALADAVDRLATIDGEQLARPQDLRELAAICLVASRRLNGIEP